MRCNAKKKKTKTKTKNKKKKKKGGRYSEGYKNDIVNK